MPTLRQDVMRILVDIDQELAGLRAIKEKLDPQSDEVLVTANRMVCMHAARMMAEDKLSSGEEIDPRDYEAIVALSSASKRWPGR